MTTINDIKMTMADVDHVKTYKTNKILHVQVNNNVCVNCCR
jgi:hypothetical protein